MNGPEHPVPLFVGKELFRSESSAHLPHDEEPERFAFILSEIKARTERQKNF